MCYPYRRGGRAPAVPVDRVSRDRGPDGQSVSLGQKCALLIGLCAGIRTITLALELTHRVVSFLMKSSFVTVTSEASAAPAGGRERTPLVRLPVNRRNPPRVPPRGFADTWLQRVTSRKTAAPLRTSTPRGPMGEAHATAAAEVGAALGLCIWCSCCCACNGARDLLRPLSPPLPTPSWA